MKANAAKILIAAGLLAAACIASPASLHAQAAPGPIRPAPESQSSDGASAAPPPPVKQFPPQKKENLIGSWRINPDESDDARQKIEQARTRGSNNPNAGSGGNNPYPGNGGGNGPYGRPGNSPYPGNGSPYPGSGGSNGPYGRHGGSTASNTTYEDRQQLQDLIEPATSLTFTQKEGEVDVTDDQGRKRIYLTDSRKPQKSKDESYKESAAHWEGARLVSEEKGTHGGRITRTYELTPGGKQLAESVRLDNTHTGLVTVRYVFDVASSSTPPTAPAAK
jgi:Spy/CpxP family protein refolding chaperone